MPGFYVSNYKLVPEIPSFEIKSIIESISYLNYNIIRYTLDKFLNDKIFFENEDYIIILEGVILNKKLLLTSNNMVTLKEYIITRVNLNQFDFFKDFRGSFSGAIYHKKRSVWHFYTNHIGDKPLFYYIDGVNFIVSSDPIMIIKALRKLRLQISLDEEAVKSMLAYGYMHDSFTYCKEVKRILPGNYLEISNNVSKTLCYHKFDFTYNKNIDIKSLIHTIEVVFDRAVKMEIEKDIEYDYNHLVDLSGGLDSRMVNIVGKKYTVNKVLNITYSQNDYLDEAIAKKISSDLGNDFIFYSLNSASFIYDLNKTVSMNYGLSYYAGITGGNRLLGFMNLNNFGLEHTGQLGDVILGTFLKRRDEKIDFAGMYSKNNSSFLNKDNLDKFNSKEEYMIYVRGFLGTLNSHLIRQNYTEVTSPFLDVDFMQVCFSIPPEFRINHKLYKDWIRVYHNSAMNYKWEKTKTRIYNNSLFENIVIKYKRFIDRVLRKLGLSENKSMNPFDKWYNTNSKIYHFINEYYNNNIHLKIIPENVQSILQESFHSKSVITKLQVLTVIESLKVYFDES